jgi:hypothetical protein
MEARQAAASNREAGRFVRRRAEVAEADRETVHAARAKAPASLGRMAVFTGLPGAGARTLAREVAGALERPVAEIRNAAELFAARERGAVAAVPLEALDDPDMCAALGREARVFYVMAETQDAARALAGRAPKAGADAGTDAETLAASLGALRQRLEPVALGLAGGILPTGGTWHERLADALDKIRMGT